MKRTTAMLMGSLAICAVSGPASADTSLRFAYVHSPQSPAGEAADHFRERVEAETEGRVEVQNFPSSQLGNDRELFSSARTGSVDMALTPYPMLADIVPELSVYVAGYMFNDFDEQSQILNHPDLGQAWSERLREEGGLRVLCSFLYGTRHLTTTNMPVLSRDDLDGLRIRAVPHPSSMAVVNGLGGTPTPVPFSELFQGLQQGVIDGQENPLATIDSQRIYEVQGFLIMTGHQLVALPLLINDESWQELGDDQAAVQQVADESCQLATELTLEKEANLVESFQERGVTVITVSDGLQIGAFREAVRAEVEAAFDGPVWPQGTVSAVENALGR